MTDSSGLSRRGFLQAGMLAGAGGLPPGRLPARAAPQEIRTPKPPHKRPHLLARRRTRCGRCRH